MASFSAGGTVQATVAVLLAELERLPSPPSIAVQPQPAPTPLAQHKHNRRADRHAATTTVPPLLAPRPTDLLDHASIVDAICRLVVRLERVQAHQLFLPLLVTLPEQAAVVTITAFQSVADRLDCLHSLLSHPTNPADSASEHSDKQQQQQEGLLESVQAITDRIVPLLSGRYVCLHERVVRLLLALYSQPRLSAVRLPLQQLVLSQWPLQGKARPASATSLSSFPLPLSVLCELSCNLLTADSDAAFTSSLQAAVLSCLLSHSHAASRLVIIRRMLVALLAASCPTSAIFARQLLAVLVDRWHALIASTTPSSPPIPPLLASDGVSVLGLLSFPAIPSLASLSIVHPLLLDVYVILCLYFDALSSVAVSGQEWERLLLSVCSVGLSCPIVAVNKQSAFLLRKYAASSHAAASPSIMPGAWLTYLSIMDALRTSQTHLVLSVWPRLYSLTLPAVFLGLLMDKALRGGTRLACALELIKFIIDNPQPSHTVSLQQWNEHCCRFIDIVPAILSGPFLHFLNTSHGELPKAPIPDAEPDDAFPGQVKRLLTSYFLSLPDNASNSGSAAMSPRAVWMRHWLAAMDSTLSSHLALRQQLTVLSTLPPVPAFTDVSYLHLISILSTRISIASGLLRPQLIPAIVAMLCRHTAFVCCVADAAAGDGVVFGRWCEALSLLPIDTFIASSPLHSMLTHAMAVEHNSRWLEDNITQAWMEWLALDEYEHIATAASSDINLSPLLSSASRLMIAFSLISDSSSAVQRCTTLLSRALSGCYSRTHQSSLQRMRALSLLAYCLPTVLCPAAQSPVLPSVLGLPACYLPGGVVARPASHMHLSAVVSLLADELFALCEAMLQQALVDTQRAELYRGVVVPLLYFLFVGFSSVAAVIAYQRRLSVRVMDALLQAESVSSHTAFSSSTACGQLMVTDSFLVPTALLTLTAALTTTLLPSSSPSLSSPDHAGHSLDAINRSDFTATSLLRRLSEIDLGRRPAAVSGTEWASLVEQLHAFRFTAVRHLLLTDRQHTSFVSDGTLLSSLFHHCLGALDSATDAYLPIVYDCLRLLLPLAHTSAASLDLDTVFPLLLTRAQAGFEEEVRDEPFTLAYVSLLFTPALFAHRSLHSSPTALYRRLLPQLVTFSKVHPRFAYYFASFTAVLFSLYPQLALPYISVLLGLATYHDSGSQPEEEQVTEALAAYQLAHLTHNMSVYDECAVMRDEHVIGKSDTMTRLAALLYVERCIQTLSSTTANEAYRSAVQSVLAELLRCVLQSPILRETAAETVGGSSQFITKVYTLQTLCILTRSLAVLPDFTRASLTTQLLSLAWDALERGSNSITRHLLEVCLSSVFITFPALVHTHLLPRFSQYMSRPTLLASLVVIAGYATIDTAEPSQLPSLLPVVLSYLLPVLSSNYGHTRLVGQFWYWRLYSTAITFTPPALPFTSPEAVALLKVMYDALTTNVDVVKLRDKQAVYFASFHPVSRCTVRGLLADANDSYSLLPAPLLGRAQHIISDYLSGLRLAYDEHYSMHRDKEPPIADGDGVPKAVREEGMSGDVAGQSKGGEMAVAEDGTNFQQKFGMDQAAQWSELYSAADGDNVHDELDEDEVNGGLLWDEDDEAEDEEQKRRTFKQQHAAQLSRQRQSLIARPRPARPNHHATAASSSTSSSSSSSRSSLLVIASLVTSAPNLAGLTRSCEIFGVQSLSLSSLVLLNDPLFLRVSVSSHRWLPLRELAVSQLLSDVRRLKGEGYRVVALEQTAHSSLLTEYEWDERSVLVLGNEREGVPVDVLNEVDECVVIPQQGVIRSLNVHVAASIAIFEYNRQRDVRGRQRAAATNS